MLRDLSRLIGGAAWQERRRMDFESAVEEALASTNAMLSSPCILIRQLVGPSGSTSLEDRRFVPRLR